MILSFPISVWGASTAGQPTVLSILIWLWWTSSSSSSSFWLRIGKDVSPWTLSHKFWVHRLPEQIHKKVSSWSLLENVRQKWNSFAFSDENGLLAKISGSSPHFRDAALMAGIGSSRTQLLRHVSALNYGWMEPRLRFELDCCKCLDKKAVRLGGGVGIIRGWLHDYLSPSKLFWASAGKKWRRWLVACHWLLSLTVKLTGTTISKYKSFSCRFADTR